MKLSLTQFVDAVVKVAPVVLPLAGVPPVLTGIIVHGMVTAEHLPGKSGPEKKAYVEELTATAAQGLNEAAGRQVVDVEQIKANVSHGIDLVVETAHTAHNVPVKGVVGSGLPAATTATQGT